MRGQRDSDLLLPPHSIGGLAQPQDGVCGVHRIAGMNLASDQPSALLSEFHEFLHNQSNQASRTGKFSDAGRVGEVVRAK